MATFVKIDTKAAALIALVVLCATAVAAKPEVMRTVIAAPLKAINTAVVENLSALGEFGFAVGVAMVLISIWLITTEVRP